MTSTEATDTELTQRAHRAAATFRVSKTIGRHVLVYGVAFLISVPFLWVLVSSFKPETELVRYPPTILPETWTLSNYTEFFRATKFHLAMRNSAFLAIMTTFFSILVAAPAAYALSRFRGRTFGALSRLFIFTYMVPPILLVLPVFRIYFDLGWSNNLPALVLIYVAFIMPLSLWMLRSFFAGVPRELDEAAMTDGATRFQAFWHVIMPQAAPGIIAASIVATNIGWSEYLFAATLLSKQEVMTISPRLESFMGRGLYNWGWLMAGSIAVTAPLIVLGIAMQRRFAAGIGSGAIR
jgi:ABC-type glycerol-3-phosphate transport system permease component